jgi:hypothetical protein
MYFLLKFGQIIIILIVIYLWNTYLINTLIKSVIISHKRNNTANITKQPIKFFVDNEKNIIKFGQYFYWFGGLIISLNILFN